MNIFDIQKNLQEIYNELEETGGELTPELEESLQITETDLKDKVKAYVDIIKQLEYDNAAIKEEKARLDSLKKTKDKTIEKLRSILLYTLDKFGYEDKRGVKSIDYGTGKISTRKSTSLNVNQGIIDTLVDQYFINMQWLKDNNQLDVHDGLDKIDYLDKLNTEDDSVPITSNDLNEVNVDINLTVPLNTLFAGKGYNFISNLLKYTSSVQTKASVDKTRMKELIKTGANYEAIANMENKLNLTIK